MAGRYRILLLIGTLASQALPLARAQEAPPGSGSTPITPESRPLIEPEVPRREIERRRIDTEDFEVGLSGGILSIEDFGSSAVVGLRFDYHVSEDLFLSLDAGRARAGETSFERLGGDVRLLTDAERDYTYYELGVGWNLLPGEAFVGSGFSFNQDLYLSLAAGATRFAGDDRFTVAAGVGYRLLLTDWAALRLDARDHVFDIDLLGESRTTHNLELLGGLTIFF